MLFQSIEFTLLYLPAVIAGFLIVQKFGGTAKIWFLLFASIAFYTIHSKWYVFLLLTSILCNFLVGGYLRKAPQKWLLAIAIAINLAVLGYYKYLYFFSNVFTSATGIKTGIGEILLPIAISFFTFEQIAYIVDSYKGTSHRNNLRDYSLFVFFFPHLIAGPIIRQQQLVDQFKSPEFLITKSSLGFGLSIFIIGLSKKLFIADHFASLANPVFDSAVKSTIEPLTAWGGALAYTLQIYFDFSAYSDMAIGLSAIFGIALPLNFLSPYKSATPSEFWRRWHITLSQFLRDYLYIPLGGNRVALPRTMVNLLIVMTLGGLWHGAGWAYLLWGVMHGVYLAVERAFSNVSFSLPHISKVLITFILVLLAWVPFRAGDAAFLSYYNSMFMLHETVGKAMHMNWITIAAGLLACWFLPNTAQLFGLAEGTSIRWRPNINWALTLGCFLFAAIVIMMEEETYAFIYFQF
jgi:alginate O-acetyltransferase complex protein AlgI